MATKRVLIFGATSAIAQSVARIYAADGAEFYLVGRSTPHLTSIADDLRVRGAGKVSVATADLRSSSARGLVSEVLQVMGKVDVALLAHGVLVDQSRCTSDAEATDETIATNFTSYAQLALALVPVLAAQRSGTLVALGSVAGDRGKKSNFVYGAAKAGVAVLMQGLMAELRGSGAHALLVKLGFVDTPMTAHLTKGLLWVSPDYVAQRIVRAVHSRRTTIYVPAYWRLLMATLRALPDAIFTRLGL